MTVCVVVSAMTDTELVEERKALLDQLLALGESYRNTMQQYSEAEKSAHRMWGDMQKINERLEAIALEREARDA